MRPRLVSLLAMCAALFNACPASAEGLVEAVVRRFTESDFAFVRAHSNAPFLPLAWVTASTYREGTFTLPGGDVSEIGFRQASVSQGALVPIPVGKRDAFAFGEWVSWTRFELDNAESATLDVLSVAIPAGWIRQARRDWQVAAFVAPMGHRTNRDGWYWETLGGVFGRYLRNDRVAWIFGAYADVSSLEQFYTPYIGATFVIDERWTINAVMPWPGVTYAPNPDVVFRLGVAPSGSSWAIDENGREPRMSLSQWNFGFSAERRLYKSLWLGAEVGVAALRGLSVVGGEWQGAHTDVENTTFARVSINLRPSPAATR